MKKDEIVKVVREYINNEKAKYAVMITGVWGSGKTYLYENCLKGEIDGIVSGKDKADRLGQVYISLYGTSSVEELSKEILLNYFMISGLNGDEKKANVLKGIGSFIGILSKGITFSMGGSEINFGDSIEEGKELIEKQIQAKNMRKIRKKTF